jgi:hypothetical protein
MMLVDQIVSYSAEATTDKGLPGREWSHLHSSDLSPAGEQKLRAFAVRIGCRESWIQYPGHPTRVHYDLTPSMRAKALKAGAVSIDAMAYARARMTGQEAVDAYLAGLAPRAARPVFGVTKAPIVDTRPAKRRGRA